jgi:hypothetical protein
MGIKINFCPFVAASTDGKKILYSTMNSFLFIYLNDRTLAQHPVIKQLLFFVRSKTSFTAVCLLHI